MVSVPVRAPPVLAATLSVTIPSPLPAAPPVMVIHGTALVAVHAHPSVDVTSIVREPPAADVDVAVGSIEEVQSGAAALWLRATPSPSIVIEPLRAAPPLRATRNATLPLPVPSAPEVIVIQLTMLDALHEQPSGAVTPTVLVAPFASNCRLLVASSTRQGAASWTTGRR